MRRFSESELSNLKLRPARRTPADQRALAFLRRGIEEWNALRSEYPWDEINLHEAELREMNLRRANLHDADLSGADLSGADLSEADLSGADLRGAGLLGANLREADLSYANLSGADLRDAILAWANLWRADLHEADLNGTDFSGAQLSSADLSGSIVNRTSFGNVNLSSVQGLELVKHLGPSQIGVDTIYRSGGQIPETFLRGTGVPEDFIVYMRSLVTGPIEFYSCFISYSSRDQAFAERLYADLRAKNLRCWFAPEDLKIGDRFQDRIEESIRVFDKVMIVLSEASVQSRWVEGEVNAARERENRENRLVLFPIRIDDTVMNAPQAWAADIRRLRHIGDFRQWKEPDCYQKAFERLIRDLKARDQASDQSA